MPYKEPDEVPREVELAWEERALQSSTPKRLQCATSILKAHQLAVPLVRSSKFVAPVSDEPARPAGYYRVFCTHHVPYWRPCGGCKRTKKDAAAHVKLSGYRIP